MLPIDVDSGREGSINQADDHAPMIAQENIVVRHGLTSDFSRAKENKVRSAPTTVERVHKLPEISQSSVLALIFFSTCLAAAPVADAHTEDRRMILTIPPRVGNES